VNPFAALNQTGLRHGMVFREKEISISSLSYFNENK